MRRFLILLAFLPGFAFVAQDPSSAMVQDVFICASSVADWLFGGEGWLVWQGHDRDNEKLEAKAVSIFETETPLAGHTQERLWTLTPTDILSTQIKRFSDSRPFAPHQELAILMLNLLNEFDSESGFAVVDRRNSLAAGWGTLVTYDEEGHRFNDVAFRRSDFADSMLSVIAPDQALAGEAKMQGLESVKQRLNRRLDSIPDYFRQIFSYRQSRMDLWRENPNSLDGGNVRRHHPSEFYINIYDVRILREGLCMCEATKFSEEIEKVRSALLDPAEPIIEVWMEEDGVRPLRAGDLQCAQM
jgi:hypothetical protein